MTRIDPPRSASLARVLALALLGPALLVACGDDDADDGDTINLPPADAGRDRDAGPRAAVTEVPCADGVSTTIVIADLEFLPATVGIAAGDVIMWQNDDAVAHTVTSGNPGNARAGQLFDSGAIGVSESYCLRFDEPAPYEYFCATHPEAMDDGFVIVE